ncbi:MAG TPA: TM0106 family RecB-like putative nuclease, partial [Candidatus Elarobacter sp.]
MLRLDGEAVYAASDLNDFLACPHKLALGALALERQIAAPAPDPALEIIARKGALHEAEALRRFEADGRVVARVDEGDGSVRATRAAAERTVALMRSGADVIYQATLIDGRWLGRADFLVRTEEPSDLGAWSYDVADAKLAVRERASFVVQLCVYADLVRSVQGTLPTAITALYGDGREAEYDPTRFIAYVRAARARLEGVVATLDAATIPDRIGACAACVWDDTCDAARRGVDHLSLVAGMRRSQIVRLRERDVDTVVELAAAPEDRRPPRIGETTFAKLRRQAGLQLRQRATGVPTYELLEPKPEAGFALLPEPAEGDVYFDMEGDPLYEPGVGLEYLFGAYVDGASPRYERFWGETRDQEKKAFEDFIDWLVRHDEQYPRAHVYHYAPYEKTALRKLAMRHGTREEEVDALLRGQVLVDLYAVVGGAVAQSQESYSIKKLEPLYGFTRSTDVRKGDDSIVAFERYLLDRDGAVRNDIIAYNKEDCVSTFGLHGWLQRLRAEAEQQFGVEIPYRASVDPEAPSEKDLKELAERTALQTALLADAPEGDPKRLLAHLLGYHRREAKPVQWAVFERAERIGSFDFVNEDTEALGGIELRADIPPMRDPDDGPRVRRMIYTYTFPRQQHKLGKSPVDARTTKSAGEIVTLDDDTLTLRLKRSESSPHPQVLGPGWPIKTNEQQAA